MGTYSTLRRLLLFSDCHLAVVENPANIVVQSQQFLVQSLRQNVDFVLEMRALLPDLLILAPAIVLDFGAQLRTRSREQIRFL